MWRGAPRAGVVGLARLERVEPTTLGGDTFFHVRYLTYHLVAPLSLATLRRDRAFRDTSFLKAGASGTVFAVTSAQMRRLLQRCRAQNPELRLVQWDDRAERGSPRLALSIRQPWAELIMRGIKTIEVRSRQTLIRGRVHIYASLGPVDPDDEKRVRRVHRIRVERLPRGVIVGTVEIVGCRRLARTDSRAAGFRVPERPADYAWLVARPARARRLRSPRCHPQPVFFEPFPVAERR